jgi:kinesin family protein 3/17
MLENIRELQRHLQLKSMVIDLFVPHSDRARIEARAHWDEERTEWVLAPVDFTPLYAISLQCNSHTSWIHLISVFDRLYMKRPMSAPFRSGCATAQFARVASVVHENSTRYRQENIASLDLDMPERTTQDFQDQAAR